MENLRKKKQDDKIPLNIWKNSMEKVIKSDLFITLQIVPLGYIQHQWARQFKGYSPMSPSSKC